MDDAKVSLFATIAYTQVLILCKAADYKLNN